MSKQIFREGDKVFDIRYGWGEVIRVYNDTCISVKFKKECNTFSCMYRFNGLRGDNDDIPLLSFTEYTLQGFSQERPIDYKDYIGKWGKFWNNHDKEYTISKLESIVFNNEFRSNTSTAIYDNFEPLTEEQINILGI